MERSKQSGSHGTSWRGASTESRGAGRWPETKAPYRSDRPDRSDRSDRPDPAQGEWKVVSREKKRGTQAWGGGGDDRRTGSGSGRGDRRRGGGDGGDRRRGGGDGGDRDRGNGRGRGRGRGRGGESGDQHQRRGLGARNIKNTLARGLGEFTDFKTLGEFVLTELGKLGPDDAGKLLETVISWSIHELAQIPALRTRLSKIHESDGHKMIHWAVWPRWATNKTERESVASKFTREDADVVKTVQLCLELGSSPLDMNSKEETAIGALDESFHGTKGGKGPMISSTVYETVYRLLTSPGKETMKRACRQISNKLSPSSFKKTLPILNWLVFQEPELLCRAIIDNLIEMGRSMRDATTGHYRTVHERLEHVTKSLRTGPTSAENQDFDHFFEINKVRSSELLTRFRTMMVRICSEMKLETQLNTLTGDKLNVDVIGAIIGEVGTSDDVTTYCERLIELHPSIARTCLVHHKFLQTKFKCSDRLIFHIAKSYTETKDGSAKFQIIGSLEKLLGKELCGDDIAEICSTPAGMGAGTPAGMGAGTPAGMDAGTPAGMDAGTDAGTDAEAEPEDEPEEPEEEPEEPEEEPEDPEEEPEEEPEEFEKEELEQPNPYEKMVNFSALTRLKDTDDYKFDGLTFVPGYIDDLSYALSKVVASAKKDQDKLSEMIILRAMESIGSQKQVTVLLDILKEVKAMVSVKRVAQTDGTRLLECVDNPVWAPRVLEALKR